LPAGCVVAFAGEISGSPAPYVIDIERWGWMVCDGRQLRIAMYPELFAVLGFRYVHRGEPTTLPDDPQQAAAAAFRIPDYRGYFLRGVNGGGGVDPDLDSRVSPSGATSSEVGSLQQHALQDHAHRFRQVSQATGGTGEPVAGVPDQQDETVQAPQPRDNASVFFVSTDETRPKNMYVYYIVRYTNGLHGLGAPAVPPLGPRLPRGPR
jgi:microcystin-dependent protein